MDDLTRFLDVLSREFLVATFSPGSEPGALRCDLRSGDLAIARGDGPTAYLAAREAVHNRRAALLQQLRQLIELEKAIGSHVAASPEEAEAIAWALNKMRLRADEPQTD